MLNKKIKIILCTAIAIIVAIAGVFIVRNNHRHTLEQPAIEAEQKGVDNKKFAEETSWEPHIEVATESNTEETEIILEEREFVGSDAPVAAESESTENADNNEIIESTETELQAEPQTKQSSIVYNLSDNAKGHKHSADENDEQHSDTETETHETTVGTDDSETEGEDPFTNKIADQSSYQNDPGPDVDTVILNIGNGDIDITSSVKGWATGIPIISLNDFKEIYPDIRVTDYRPRGIKNSKTGYYEVFEEDVSIEGFKTFFMTTENSKQTYTYRTSSCVVINNAGKQYASAFYPELVGDDVYLSIESLPYFDGINFTMERSCSVERNNKSIKLTFTER